MLSRQWRREVAQTSRGTTERKALLHKKLCYAWSDRAIGPQCYYKKIQRLGALLLKTVFSLDLDGTCIATLHEMAALF